MPTPLTAEAVIALFDDTFYTQYNTRLVHAAGDPEYLPANSEVPYHQICFAHGYVASALHEISHWCIAGQQRRLLADFGYWYAPDGRSAAQQREFLNVEVKPQALEWAFSIACGKTFRVSTDNLNGESTSTAAFEQAVLQQAVGWCEQGFPVRASQWAQACQQHFGGANYLQASHYSLAALRA